MRFALVFLFVVFMLQSVFISQHVKANQSETMSNESLVSNLVCLRMILICFYLFIFIKG